MTAKTTRYGMTYPTGSDLVSSIPTQMKDMCESIDKALADVDDRHTTAASTPITRQTLAELKALQGITGQVGVVTADTAAANGLYFFDSNAWRMASSRDVSSMFTAGQWAADWDLTIDAVLTGNVVTGMIRAARKTGKAWTAKAWDSSEIYKIPDQLKGKYNDVNLPAIGTGLAPVTGAGITLNASSIAVRAFQDMTFSENREVQMSFSYQLATAL